MKEKNVKIGLKIGKIGNLAFARRRVLKKGVKKKRRLKKYQCLYVSIRICGKGKKPHLGIIPRRGLHLYTCAIVHVTYIHHEC